MFPHRLWKEAINQKVFRRGNTYVNRCCWMLSLNLPSLLSRNFWWFYCLIQVLTFSTVLINGHMPKTNRTTTTVWKNHNEDIISSVACVFCFRASFEFHFISLIELIKTETEKKLIIYCEQMLRFFLRRFAFKYGVRSLFGSWHVLFSP